MKTINVNITVVNQQPQIVDQDPSMSLTNYVFTII